MNEEEQTKFNLIIVKRMEIIEKNHSNLIDHYNNHIDNYAKVSRSIIKDYKMKIRNLQKRLKEHNAVIHMLINRRK